MKTKRKVAPLTATLITIGSLVGGAMGQTVEWADTSSGDSSNSGTADFATAPDASFSHTFSPGSSATTSFPTLMNLGSLTFSSGYFIQSNNSANPASFTFDGMNPSSTYYFMVSGWDAGVGTVNQTFGSDGTLTMWHDSLSSGAAWDGVDTITYTGFDPEIGTSGTAILQITGATKFGYSIDAGGSGLHALAVAVPEPSSTLLLGLGGLGLLARRRR